MLNYFPYYLQLKFSCKNNQENEIDNAIFRKKMEIGGD